MYQQGVWGGYHHYHIPPIMGFGGVGQYTHAYNSRGMGKVFSSVCMDVIMDGWMNVCVHFFSTMDQVINNQFGTGLVLEKVWTPTYFGDQRSKVKVIGSSW